ncbi:MAG: sulfite oxidase, partial [Actinobacteria bacterium]|nr:sulfite oxidase [Actinomycetota bacterium]
YLLNHYDIPELDEQRWRLRVHGSVQREVQLDLDRLRALPQVTRTVTMECAGNGRARLTPRPLSQPWLHEAIGNARWTGVLVDDVLAEAGVGEGAIEAVFTGADRGVEAGIEQSYQRSVDVDELRDTGALLAYELNGAPLPPQHGAPLRLVVPGWYGMTNVKWVTSIELVDEPFDGFQQSRSYRFRQSPDEPGEPVTRMHVRSLLIPPGMPDFFSRRRMVDRGEVELRGRAWSGVAPIDAVEVSTDDGRSWRSAELSPPDDPGAWTGFRFVWEAAAAGDTVLMCRATDAAGNRQPDEPDWNLGGYAVNAAHRVEVTVR